MYEEEIIKDRNGKPIRAKNAGQKKYVEAIRTHDVVFGVGPAGTGKDVSCRCRGPLRH